MQAKSRTVLVAAAMLMSAPAAAQHMNADVFYQRAQALKKKGALAMLSGRELRLLIKEVKAAGNLVKQTRLASEQKGKRGRYCPPPGARRMGSDEYLKALAAMTPEERRAIDLTEATTRMMESRFPCRG